MSRDGYALLSVLWLVVLLGTLIGTGTSLVVVNHLEGENRLHLVRAKWAAVACLELAKARFSSRGLGVAVDSVTLGGDLWCSGDGINPDVRINPNLGDSLGLIRVLGDVGAVASLLDWIDEDDHPREAGAESEWYRHRGRRLPRNGPLANARELIHVRGFENTSLADAEQLFTTRGDGRVAPGRASLKVLESVSLLPRQVARRIARFPDSTLTPAAVVEAMGVELTTEEFRQLSERLSFDESLEWVRFQGSVNAGRRVLTAVLIAELVRSPGQLATRRLVPQ